MKDTTTKLSMTFPAQSTITADPTIVFTFAGAQRPPGKLADAELVWPTHGGLLAGLRLIGFAVWERKDGSLYVTVPARQYSVNGERRSFALLRPSGGIAANMDHVRAAILAAYAAISDLAGRLDNPVGSPAINDAVYTGGNRPPGT